eukprot:TRINITY_DN15649_c0_g1_i1.p1 TRINITY_DN15649_c0_g1~~TRINITY_DN15649_c0_g1_i1.p1  ORF type:complete len:535 (+),score=117.76 TRINITY_DN15649_c0_g1_i1:134-1738(+)
MTMAISLAPLLPCEASHIRLLWPGAYSEPSISSSTLPPQRSSTSWKSTRSLLLATASAGAALRHVRSNARLLRRATTSEVPKPKTQAAVEQEAADWAAKVFAEGKARGEDWRDKYSHPGDFLHKYRKTAPNSTINWVAELPAAEDLERFDENGDKWLLLRQSAAKWVKESEVGTYRFTIRGYESRSPDGSWVSHAQLPEDVSHLSDAQLARLIKELRGETVMGKKIADDNDDDEDDVDLPFMPKATIPPLEQWPFMEIDITNDLKITPTQMRGYMELEMTEDIGKAYFLAARWKELNEARRHLGYNINDTIDDVAELNGVVLAMRCFVEQLKRVGMFRKATADDPVPKDSARLRALQCTGILGTHEGSAMALWLHNPAKKRVQSDICVGDDAMNKGSHAEEMLIRFLAGKAGELGAEKLWVRTRRSESAKVITPFSMQRLGFREIPADEQESEEWDPLLPVDGREAEAEEVVTGLAIWLSTRYCEEWLEAANEWCLEMGAVDINEVAECRAELADHLSEKHGLTEEAKERLLRY